MTAATEDHLESLGDASLSDHRDKPPSGEIGIREIAINNVDDVVDTRPVPVRTVVNESPVVMGHDGDDVGRSAYHQAVVDMLESGHGFLVRKIDKPKTVWRVTCETCGGPLPSPGDDPDWLCQYDETSRASPICNCPWCLAYQDYLAGRYKPQGGRPRKRCGSKECDRKAKTEAQKRERLKKRRERLLAECSAEDDEPPPTVASTKAALSRIDQVPEQSREGVRAKLNAQLLRLVAG